MRDHPLLFHGLRSGQTAVSGTSRRKQIPSSSFTAPTASDKPPVVSFRLNGKPVSTSPELLHSIPVGGMTLVCSSVGEPWTAAPGTHSVLAEADASGAIDETLESNNSATSIRSVRPASYSFSKP